MNPKQTALRLDCSENFRRNTRLSRVFNALLGSFALLFVFGGLTKLPAASEAPRKHRPPNILFIIMDDVGIDQLTAFNPAVPNPVPTPAIDTLVRGGVSFNNCWMMPECSPSRSCFFTGRFPLRTGVDTAILDYDLPQAQVSPYETTTPRVLAKAGYSSALVGKYHLGGPSNNPDGYQTPAALGWNYFNGNLHGGPPSIDPTLGGQTTNTSLYPCGFPTGNQRGVCWFQNAETNTYCDDNNGAGYTGQDCVTLGGIPALTLNGNFAATCDEATLVPAFTNYNGYYVWPRVINDGKKLSRTTSREYMSIANTDDALAWIQKQKPKKHSDRLYAGRPWMCTVSYNSIHTPYQQPPTNLYPPGFTWPTNVSEGGTNSAQIKVISDLMLYAMDQEIGRLLVGAGLATRSDSGELEYTPEGTDTMIILVGDNGTYLSSVNAPYNPLRSKSSPYQTGVCAPMIVAGPLVNEPGRTVTNMVNAVDLFQLFAEIARLDVHKVVPASHILDCEPILPYLTNANQTSLRTYNFSQLGDGVKPASVQTWPSVFTVAGQKIGNDILFNTIELCTDAGGEWFGPGAAVMYTNCCDVRANVYTNLIIQPSHVWAVRNDRYKLVKSDRAACDTNLNAYEFYDLKPTLANPIGLDNSTANLLENPDTLTQEQAQNLADLHLVLDNILNSEPKCYGDGNLDKKVNHKDVSGVRRYWGQPSVFDFNEDGVTDQQDLDCVLSNKGHNCLETGPGEQCN